MYIYIYIYVCKFPLALHLGGQPGVYQASSGPCDRVPFLGQHTTWAQAYVVRSRRAVLLRVAVALTSRLLLCRTSGCSRSATPLPTLLRNHTRWPQACDSVFSSFSFLVWWWRRFRVVGPFCLVVPLLSGELSSNGAVGHLRRCLAGFCFSAV